MSIKYPHLADRNSLWAGAFATNRFQVMHDDNLSIRDEQAIVRYFLLD